MLFTFLTSNDNKNYVIAYLTIHKKVAYEDQTNNWNSNKE